MYILKAREALTKSNFSLYNLCSKRMESTSTKHYDFLVIGAGSGGLGAARRAAMFGKQVAMVENRIIGGTCVNVGCVPKKVMLNLANFLEETHLFADYGVNGLDSVQLDFPTFKKHRDAYVSRLNTIYHKNAQSSNVDFIQGTARFVTPKEIQVSDNSASGKRLSADHVLIASGSAPSISPTLFPGVEHCISSDGIFAMDTLPKSMIVVGGGYIGVEMSQIMHAFGVHTTLLVKDFLLGRVDQEIVDLLVENMKKSGLGLRFSVQITKVEKNESTGLLTATLSDGSTM
jgi:glutathione reductase (NADPH)